MVEPVTGAIIAIGFAYAIGAMMFAGTITVALIDIREGKMSGGGYSQYLTR